MVVYEVKPEELIESVAEELSESENLQPPEWAEHAKTGVSREQSPQQDDWWYTRAASILRKVYEEGPIGVRKMAKRYGRKERGGNNPAHYSGSSRNVVRTVFQQLEEEGLVRTVDSGRDITPEGRSFLDEISNELSK